MFAVVCSKQRVQHFERDGSLETERYYFGRSEYERTADQSNPAMTQFPFSEGRVTKNGSDLVYDYQMKDSRSDVPHLGNIQACLPVGRGSFVWGSNISTPSSDGQTNMNDIGVFALKQEDYYYPFGLRSMRLDASSGNRYLYNGKELETFHDLSYYEGACPLGMARFYACPTCGNPQLGRWHAVDPMRDKYLGLSPYNYCANNPIRLIDPNGMYFGESILNSFVSFLSDIGNSIKTMLDIRTNIKEEPKTMEELVADYKNNHGFPDGQISLIKKNHTQAFVGITGKINIALTGIALNVVGAEFSPGLALGTYSCRSLATNSAYRYLVAGEQNSDFNYNHFFRKSESQLGIGIFKYRFTDWGISKFSPATELINYDVPILRNNYGFESEKVL